MRADARSNRDRRRFIKKTLIVNTYIHLTIYAATKHESKIRIVDDLHCFPYNASALYDAWCSIVSLIAKKGGFDNRAGNYHYNNGKEDLFCRGGQRNP